MAMIKYYILLVFMFVSTSLLGQHLYKLSVSDSLLYLSLSKIKKDDYIGKTVGSFLAYKEIAKYNRYYWIDEPPGCLNGAKLIYSKKIGIKIIVKKYTILKRFSMYSSWSFEDFKKEKISDIEIVVQ